MSKRTLTILAIVALVFLVVTKRVKVPGVS